MDEVTEVIQIQATEHYSIGSLYSGRDAPSEVAPAADEGRCNNSIRRVHKSVEELVEAYEVIMGDSIKYQGSLEKQGRLKTWSWKKYWFVLQDDQLCYFKDEKRSSSQGLISMSQTQTVRLCKGSGNKGYSFEIVTKSRTHILAAPSADLRDKWIKYLQQAMTLQSRKSLSQSQSMSTPSCNSISDDEEVVYESIGDGEVFYDESTTKNGKPVDKDQLIVENDMYIGKGGSRKTVQPKVSSTYTEVRDVVGGPHDPDNGKVSGISIEDDEEDGYAQVHRESLMSEGDSHSLVSQDSLYSDARRQHKDLKRLCEPSPRLAPLLRRTRLAQMENSNSSQSNYSDSATTGDEADRESAEEAKLSLEDMECDYATVDPSHGRLSPEDSSENDVSPSETPPPTPPKHQYRIPKDANIDLDFNFSEIPDLPHPRRELAWDTPFDQIRIFLANNRGPTEFYTAQKIGESNGEGIRALKEFLEQIESVVAEEPEEENSRSFTVEQEQEDRTHQSLEPLPDCNEIEITSL